MAVSVIIPWRPSPDRVPLWTFLRPWWESRGWQIVEGTCPDGPWRKGLAVANGVSRATGDILVIADADVWCDGVDEAVHHVSTGHPWAVPHLMVHRLTKAATNRMLVGIQRPFATDGPDLERPPYAGQRAGGIVVMHHTVWDHAPLDPRFADWGQEDEAWNLALTVLAGEPWRPLDGRPTSNLWHLWHEPQPRLLPGLGSDDSLALFKRYQQASIAADPRAAMAALLAEVEG